MQPLSLDEAPPGVSSEGVHVWLDGTPAEPGVGDLWLLSWDGTAAGLVILARIVDDYVLGWPVTLAGDPAFAPAVLLDSSPLGIRLTVWPTLETGLGEHLLHRRLGTALVPEVVSRVRRTAIGGEPGPLPTAERSADEELDAAFLSELLITYRSLCFNEWSTAVPGVSVLDRGAMMDRGIEVRRLAHTLDVDVPLAASLLRQDQAPTESQLRALASDLGVDEAALITPPSGSWVRELRRPRYKDDLRRLALKLNTDERHARAEVQAEYSRAARVATGDARTRTKLQDAIDRLLERA